MPSPSTCSPQPALVPTTQGWAWGGTGTDGPGRRHGHRTDSWM